MGGELGEVWSPVARRRARIALFLCRQHHWVCGDPKEPPGANDACGQEALFSGGHLGWNSDPGSSPAFLLGTPA